MRKLLLLVVLLALPAMAQLSTMESKPHLVQSNEGVVKSLAYFSNVTSGHLLITAWHSENQTTAPTIADNLSTPTSYSLVINGTTNHCGYLYVWAGIPTVSGADTVTLTTTNTSFQHMSIAEFSNTTATTDGTSVIGWTTLATITSGSITTAVNGDLLYSVVHNCNSPTLVTSSPSLPVTVGFSADNMAAGYNIAGANGSYSASFINNGGASSSGNVAIVAFKPAAALTVVTTALPEASTSVAYSAQLNAEAGSGAYTWAITSGALPAGLSLASGGAITGTPTASAAGPITFQVTDGVSATATQALSINVGTSFNTVGFVQSHSYSACATASLGTVTAGNVLLLAQTFASATGVVSSSRVTWSLLPLSEVVKDSLNHLAIGVVNSTGTDTLTCTGNPKATIVAEFSNIQAIFDEAANVMTIGTSASTSTITSGSMTAPVRETLFSAAQSYTSTGTETIQSPFTTDTSAAAGSTYIADGYQIGAASGSQTVSYSQVGNTDTHWGIIMMGLRPGRNGTAPTGGVQHRSQVY